MTNVAIRAEKKIVVRNLLGVVVLIVACSCFQIPFGLFAALWAQDTQNEHDQSSIRVKVELVNTPVVVRDARGEYIGSRLEGLSCLRQWRQTKT